MKISEIADENKSWAILSGITFTFDQEYNNLVETIQLVMKMKHGSKYPALIEAIARFKIRANDLMNAKLPNLDDLDLVNLKENVRQMLNHLAQLEQQLK